MASGIRATIIVALACAALRAEQSLREPLQVGQRWRYQHEGPRPGSIEPDAIDGERILWVVGEVEGAGGPLRVVEERFTRDPKVVGRLHVGEDGLLEAIEIENEKGEVARLRYDPPVPYQPPGMAIGETRTLVSTLRLDSANFALPSKTILERMADETVVTPAGEFANCSHYRSVTTSTFDIKIAKIPFTEERERWFHPASHGMVKEFYRRGPVKFLGWSRPGYTATSTLTTYDSQEPGSPNNVPDAAGSVKRDPVRPQTESPTRPPAWLILLVVLLAAAAGGFLLVRRGRNRRRNLARST